MSSLLVSVAATVLAVLLLLPPRPLRRERAVGWLVPSLVVGGALALVVGRWIVPLIIVGGALVWGRLLWRRRQEARRVADRARRVAEVCDLLAAELRAGRPAPAALDEAAAAYEELRPVADAARLNGDVPAALRTVAHRPGASGLRLLAGAWAVSHRTGAGLAESTRRVADAVRAEQETSRVVAGELSSARSTARLVAGLPVLALAMGSGAGSDPWSFLLATPAGLACLAGGLAAAMTGLWWIEAIAREATR